MKYILFIVWALMGKLLAGQTFEVFKIQYSYLPNGEVSEGMNDTEVDFSEFEASFLLPIKTSEPLRILAGVTYSMAFPQSSENNADTKLYFIALRAIGIYDFDEKNRVVGVFIPSISSTLQDKLTSDDFLTQASLSYSRLVNESFNYGLGVMYTSRFGFPQVLPLFTLKYIREKIRYDLRLPLSIQATWAYDSNLSYGLKFNVNGSQFNSAEGSIYDGVQIDAVNFSRILFGPEVGIRLKNQIFLNLYAGISLRRVFELNSESGPDQDLSLNNGAFISAKISLKPKQTQRL